MIIFKLPYRGLVPPREAKYSSWTNVGDPCDQSEALDGLPLACVCRKSVGQKQRWQSSTGKKHLFSYYLVNECCDLTSFLHDLNVKKSSN